MTDEEFLAEVECQLEVTNRQMEIDGYAYTDAKATWLRTCEVHQALVTIKKHLLQEKEAANEKCKT